MDKTFNIYTVSTKLKHNEEATAAALDLVGKACSSSTEGGKKYILEWVSKGDNLIKLRDKIKESASGT